MTNSKAWLPILGLSLLSTSVFSEDRLQTIVVFGERDARQLNETASTTAVVASDAIEAAGVEHLHQLLQTVPGVWLSRGSGQEHLTAIRSPVFTGAGACGAFGMTEDGIALSANGFCNVNQMFDSHFESADSIEVYKGPHTSMVGGNAQFGGINVHLPDAHEVSDQVAIKANSQGYRRFNSQIGLTQDKQSVAALLTLTEDDDFRHQAGFKQQKLTLKHSWQNTSWSSVDSGLSVMHLEQETAGYIEGYEAYKDKALSEQNLNPEAYRDADALRLYSRWRYRKLDTEWIVTPYLRSNKMDFLMHFVPWQPVEENDHNSIGWQLQWQRYLARGSKLFWGQEFEQTWANLSEVQSQPAPFQPQQFPQGTHYDYGVSSQTAALYAGGFWQTTSNLALDTSVRLDYLRYDYNNRASDGSACAPGDECRFYRPQDRVDDYLEPSAHLGAIYHLRNQMYGFARAAISFRAPQASELYRAQTPDFQELDAEQTQSLEFGLRGEPENWFYEVSLYAMKNRDGILQDTERRYVNGVNSRHLGLEYKLRYAPQVPVSVTVSGTVASHTYQNNPSTLGSSAPLSGLQMDTAPRNEHSLELRWWPVANLDLSALWHWQGEYYLDPENQFEYEGHNLLDLEGNWTIRDAVQFQVSLLNVFDRRYAERADTSFGDYRYFPGLERRVSAGIKYQF